MFKDKIQINPDGNAGVGRYHQAPDSSMTNSVLHDNDISAINPPHEIEIPIMKSDSSEIVR